MYFLWSFIITSITSSIVAGSSQFDPFPEEYQTVWVGWRYHFHREPRLRNSASCSPGARWKSSFHPGFSGVLGMWSSFLLLSFVSSRCSYRLSSEVCFYIMTSKGMDGRHLRWLLIEPNANSIQFCFQKRTLFSTLRSIQNHHDQVTRLEFRTVSREW